MVSLLGIVAMVWVDASYLGTWTLRDTVSLELEYGSGMM